MLKQLKSGFKRTINWNKYQSKRSIERQKTILAYLIDPSFQRVNKYFFYHLKIKLVIEVHIRYYFPAVEVKDYIMIIDGKISQLKII